MKDRFVVDTNYTPAYRTTNLFTNNQKHQQRIVTSRHLLL